jgi:hypothetical protein
MACSGTALLFFMDLTRVVIALYLYEKITVDIASSNVVVE